MGMVDLVAWGWAGNARLLFLISAILMGLLVSCRRGFAMLVVSRAFCSFVHT